MILFFQWIAKRLDLTMEDIRVNMTKLSLFEC